MGAPFVLFCCLIAVLCYFQVSIRELKKETARERIKNITTIQLFAKVPNAEIRRFSDLVVNKLLNFSLFKTTTSDAVMSMKFFS